MLGLILGVIGFLAINVVVGIAMGLTGAQNVSGLGYHHMVRDQSSVGIGRRLGESSQGSPAARQPDPVTGGMGGAGWRAMRTASWLMPPGAGKRWLMEAESYMAEALPGKLGPAMRSYMVNAPKVVTVSWASFLKRRPNRTRSDPAS